MPRQLIRTSAGCRNLCSPVVAAVLLSIVFAPQLPNVAQADTAAGSAAFEKGDYVLAMAEFATAAHRGDPDGEFGLGMLYERGDGTLKQNYKEAVHWYEEAAAQGNIGAEYRLTLIYSAGSEDFPADLVEAYKWILLASEQGLATGVKDQLAMLLNDNQRAEADKRAAAWKQAHAAQPPTTAPPSTAPPVVTAPPIGSGATGGSPHATGPAAPPLGAAPVATSKGGGCPGWPFPTLPCTEQFPSFGAAPAQQAGRGPGAH
jgi:Sel1 repeat-containing protein